MNSYQLFHEADNYVPGTHDGSTNTQTVYTVTTQIDFVRIVTIMILPHFISNWTTLMF